MGRTPIPDQAADLELLWLTEHWPPAGGGMAQSCDRIVSQLRRLGARVHVIHLSRRAAVIDERVQLGGSLLVWPLGSDPEHALARLLSRLSQGRLAASTGGDGGAPTDRLSHVIAFGGVLPLLAGPVAAALLARPLVVCLRGNDIDTGIMSLRRRPIVADAIQRAALVCCVSRDKVRLIEAMWPGAPAAWTPNGIDLSDWQVTAGDTARAVAWRAATVDPERRVLGLFGQLKSKKGVDWLVSTLARSGAADRLHLLLVGDLDPVVAETLPVEASTHVPFGDRYDLLSWLPACDAVALPSFYDGLPNVVLEAAAVGAPLMAAAVAGMTDILEDGATAILFEPDNDDELRQALETVAGCPDQKLVGLGQAARRMVETGFTAAAEADRYVDVLTSISTGSPVTGGSVAADASGPAR
jgi:glycosyltransferase involved in cell wall biosynthesis